MHWYICMYMLITSPFATSEEKPKPSNLKHDDGMEFGGASVSVAYKLSDSIKVQLEAFKVRSKATDRLRLRWVSIGYPRMEKYANGDVFQFTSAYITARVKLLGSAQKKALAEQAKKDLRNNEIVPEDFTLIPLQSFTCDLPVIHEGKSYKLAGTVFDFNVDPLILKFPYAVGHQVRTAFEQYVASNGNADISLQCWARAAGTKVSLNTLIVEGKKGNTHDLAGKLVGKAAETFVTRQQMTKFAEEVKTDLKITEVYEYDGDKFAEKYIDKILKQAGTALTEIDFGTALNNLSSYGVVEDGRTLDPDVITNELSNVLMVKGEGGKQRIVAAKTDTDTGKHSTNVGVQTKSSVNIAGVVGGEMAADHAVKHGQSWENDQKSVDDQLHDINAYSNDNVKFKRNGTKIVPKSLNVYRVSMQALSQNFNFQDVKKRLTDAKYVKQVRLSTAEAAETVESWLQYKTIMQTEVKELEERNKIYNSIVMDARKQVDAADVEVNANLKAMKDRITSRLSTTETTWRSFPGYAKRISAKGDKVWAVNEHQQVSYWKDNKWFNTKHVAEVVSASSDDVAWIQDIDYHKMSYRYDVIEGSNKAGRGEHLLYVSSYSKNVAIGIDRDGVVYRWKNDWERLTSNSSLGISEASIGEEDEIWAVDFNSNIYRYDEGKRFWETKPGKAKHISVQNVERVAITDSDDVVSVWNRGHWRKLLGKECSSVSIGGDKVYCAAYNGEIFVTDA